MENCRKRAQRATVYAVVLAQNSEWPVGNANVCIASTIGTGIRNTE